MVDRSVEVRLRANVADFNRDISSSAVVTDRLDASLSKADASTSRLGSTSRKTAKDVDTVGDSAKRSGNEIDKLSGRLKLYMQLAATAGPGLIPIAATAAPGLGGVIALLASGAAGALAMVVALQGVGEATKAIDAYQLDPTVENLQKARESIEALPKSAQAFVLAFQDFQPTLDGLQTAAANGVMPGLIETLENAKTLAPQVEGFLQQVGRAAGDAAADSSASLASDRWRDVFDYFTGEAPDKLTALTGIVGDLGHGFSNLLISLDTGSDSAVDWIGDVADNFDRWSESEKGREDVRALTDYLRENGPAVEDFFVGGANAITQLVQAAAPLGGPTLTIMTKLLEGFAGIADSDIGTPLLAAAAGLSVYNRALAVTARLQNSAVGQKTGMFGGLAADAVVGQKSISMVDKLKARTPAVRDFGNALAFAAFSNDTLTKSTTSGSQAAGKSAANALRARAAVAGWASDTAKAAAPFAKTAAAVAGFAVVSTGAADKIGLTNTASLALMGTMAGPYGAALGAAAGMVVDITAANDGWIASQEAVTASYEASTGAFVARAAALRDMRAEVTAQAEAEANTANYVAGKGGLFANPKDSIRVISGALGDNGDDQAQKYRDAAAAAREADQAVASLAASMGRSVGPIDGSARSAAELDAVLTSAQPAMDALSISQQRLVSAYGLAEGPIGGMADALAEVSGSEADSTFDKMTEGISSYLAQADSMAGRTRGVGEAIAGLDDELMSTVDSAGALSTALDALLGPNLNLSQATDDWTRSLRTLDDDLAEHSRQLTGNTTGALTNRDAIRSRVGELSNMISLEAEAGAGPAKLARTLQTQKKALLDSAESAGLSRKATARLIAQMGLTPKLVRTVFKAAEADRVASQVKGLRKTYDQLPKSIQSVIRANGVPKTRADVNALTKAYNLTPKEKSTLMRLVDQATGKGKAVQALIKQIGGMQPKPTVNLNDQATGRAQGIKYVIDSITGKTVTITTVHRDVRVGSSAGVSANPTHNADGGYIRGPGGPRDDVIPAMLSDREYVINAAAVAHYGVGMMDALNSRQFADGGLAEKADDFMRRLTPDSFFAGGGQPGGGNRGGGDRNRGEGFQLFGGRRPGPSGPAPAVDPTTAAALRTVAAILGPIQKSFDRSLDKVEKQGKRALQRADNPKERREALRDLQRDRVEVFRDRVKKAADALKRETEERNDLIGSMKDYSATVATAYQHDLFGNGLAGFQLQADADTNDANTAFAALQTAMANGLDGALLDALRESGDVNTITQFGALDAAQIAIEEARFAARGAATARIGDQAGLQRYGAAIDTQNQILSRLDHNLDRFSDRLDRLGDQVRAGARSGTRQGAAEHSKGQDRRTTQGVRAQGRGGGGRAGGRAGGRRGGRR